HRDLVAERLGTRRIRVVAFPPGRACRWVTHSDFGRTEPRPKIGRGPRHFHEVELRRHARTVAVLTERTPFRGSSKTGTVQALRRVRGRGDNDDQALHGSRVRLGSDARVRWGRRRGARAACEARLLLLAQGCLRVLQRAGGVLRWDDESLLQVLANATGAAPRTERVLLSLDLGLTPEGIVETEADFRTDSRSARAAIAALSRARRARRRRKDARDRPSRLGSPKSRLSRR